MKLFSINENQFMSGISTSPHFRNRGFWWKAQGINPFINPAINSSQMGILQTCPTPTQLLSATSYTILAGVSRITGTVSGNLYMIGLIGNFLNKDLSNDNAPTNLRSGTPITNAANGIQIFKPTGGTEYLYYWQYNQIGRWDLYGAYPTGWTDNHFTGIESSENHPTHPFKDNIYYGNTYMVGYIYNNSGTAANNVNVLDFPSDFAVTCLNDDGTNLVIGITKNVYSSILRADTRVVFWDTVSPSWNREWPINDFGIISIKKYKNGFIARCQKGIYYFDYYTKPRKLRTTTSRIGSMAAADIMNDAVVFGSSTYTISSFGKLVPEAIDDVYMEPFTNFGSTADISFIDATSKVNTIYAGTYNGEFFSVSLGSGGETNIQSESCYIPLKDEYKINHLEVYLAEPLASGDSCTLSLQTDEDTSALVLPLISFASLGAVRKVTLETFLVSQQLKFKFSYTGGNVKIKQIDVYGEPNRARTR